MAHHPNRRKTDIARITRWRRVVLLIAGAGVGLSLLASFLFNDFGVRQLMKLHRTSRQLEQEIATLEARHRQLQHEAEALKHDPFTIEQLAREQLGMVREGETVYEFQDEAK